MPEVTMFGSSDAVIIVQGNGFRIEYYENRRSLRYTAWRGRFCLGFYPNENEAAQAILKRAELVR